MNTRQLEVFRAIMRDKSVTSAANSLGVSQPAVSKVLHHLESQLGYALFERIGGRLAPTTEALLLYEEADRVYRQLEVLKNLSQSIRENKVGLLRIGASSAVTYSILAKALLAFQKEHPTVKVHLNTLPKADIAELLLIGDIDFALTLSPVQAPTVRSQTLANVRMVVGLREDDPLAALNEITPLDLVGRPLISYGSQTDVGPKLEDAFHQVGLTRDLAVQISSSVCAPPLVSGGLGVALVDGLLRWNSFAGLRTVPFSPEITMPLSISTNSARPVTRFYQPFLNALRSAL
jgi:DNA-binding transcriptional LysR family regulator